MTSCSVDATDNTQSNEHALQFYCLGLKEISDSLQVAVRMNADMCMKLHDAALVNALSTPSNMNSDSHASVYKLYRIETNIYSDVLGVIFMRHSYEVYMLLYSDDYMLLP